VTGQRKSIHELPQAYDRVGTFYDQGMTADRCALCCAADKTDTSGDHIVRFANYHAKYDEQHLSSTISSISSSN